MAVGNPGCGKSPCYETVASAVALLQYAIQQYQRVQGCPEDKHMDAIGQAKTVEAMFMHLLDTTDRSAMYLVDEITAFFTAFDESKGNKETGAASNNRSQLLAAHAVTLITSFDYTFAACKTC
jgi:hypothetical protein